MSAGLETLAADQWLYTTLAADSALAAVVGTRIYRDVAPEGGVFPAVVYQLVPASDSDVSAVGGIRIMSELVYTVRGIAVGATYAGPLRAIAQRLDAVLHRASGSATDGAVLSCVRTGPIAYPETTDGVSYRHFGGRYRITVQ